MRALAAGVIVLTLAQAVSAYAQDCARRAAADAGSQHAAATPIASTPSAAAHLASGRAAEAEGRVGDARREYEAALDDVVTGRAVLLVGLARLAQVDGDPGAAIEAFAAAARLDPNNANIHKELALALGPQGRVDEAICEATAAVRIDPRDAQAHAIIGQLHLDAGQPADAIPSLSQALALKPSMYEAHYGLATAMARLGRTRDAARELELFEQGRAAAMQQRRRAIAHDVEQEESVRRRLPEGR